VLRAWRDVSTKQPRGSAAQRRYVDVHLSMRSRGQASEPVAAKSRDMWDAAK